jgi:Zn-dependent protease with chaperone function
MNATVISYALYLIIAVAMTIWVARTLHRNGMVFLVECFHGNRELAASVNHLLVVGFYLINIGFISLYLRSREIAADAQGVFELLSGKMGVVLLALGAMHFFNLYVFARMRRRAQLPAMPPPVAPTMYAPAAVKLAPDHQ